MVGIVDYNAGNIKSVERALESLKVQYVLSKNPGDFTGCDRLIFPGVGDAKYAMEQLQITGLGSFLRDWAQSRKPLFGICLGSQIIFDYSEEGDTKCLGLVKGTIRHFENVWEKPELKVPHMGWNNVRFTNGGSELFHSVKDNSDFYFVHSYLIQPDDKTVIKGVCDYGTEVPSTIQSGNIYACQFHPEKSAGAGLQILKNYCTAQILQNGEIKC
ncbi:MAG: imidazole glycerol phosphate synthase subunit HisH [Treponema sp.]|nr:imidazole glycerol phosphate synthase subunit HisH [Candidatus Treponema merdequi]